MTTTAKRTPVKKVDIQKLSSKQLEALPEEVFLASLKPRLRKFVQAAFRLKSIQ